MYPSKRAFYSTANNSEKEGNVKKRPLVFLQITE